MVTLLRTPRSASLLDCDELYFNAGRLDCSVALASQDYLRLAGPRIARIIAT